MSRTEPRLDWIAEKDQVRARVVEAQRRGLRVGLVPTMGNLHAGHASLIRAARSETDVVVVTLFVNPIQFDQSSDLEAYPRTPEQDRTICEREQADVVFAPSVEVMYPPGSCTRVQVVGLDEPLCGRNRPGHFIGVATVVTKLLNIIPADLAYFGRKDYQQAALIERLVADLDFPTKLRLCPTVREPDGLAMSSRNSRLTANQRRDAVVLFEALRLAQELVNAGDHDPKSVRQKVFELIASRAGAAIDYVELVHPKSLTAATTLEEPTLLALAVRFGQTRLIDNAILTPGGASVTAPSH